MLSLFPLGGCIESKKTEQKFGACIYTVWLLLCSYASPELVLPVAILQGLITSIYTISSIDSHVMI